MSQKEQTPTKSKPALSQALRANLAKRKAQARAQADTRSPQKEDPNASD